MRVSLVLCLGLGTLATAAEFPCEPGAATREAFKRLEIKNVTGAKRTEAQRAVLDELLAASPGDLFFNLRYLELNRSPSASRQSFIDRYKALAEKEPGNPMYRMLYAKSLIDTDTPQAIEILKKLTAAELKLAWSHMVLADIYGFGKFADRPALRGSLDAFFAACPGTLSSQPLGYLAHYAAPEQAKKYAAPLRARLSTEADPAFLQRWNNLWDIEFKAYSPAEHPQLRKQIAADLARLEQLQPNPDAPFLNLLRSGYKNADDPVGLKRIEDRILAGHSTSSEAKTILRDRWQKEHKFPGPGEPEEKKQAYQRAALEYAEEQLKKSPEEFEFLMNRFSALAQLDDAPKDQLAAAGEAMLASLRKGADWWSTPPFAFQVAKAWVKKDINLSQIPEIIELGRKDFREHERISSDRDPDDMKEMTARSDLFVKIDAAQILIDTAKKLNKPEIARAAAAGLDGVTSDKPGTQASLWNVRAKFAELEGRKLDALLMYRAAVDSRASDFKAPKKDEIAESVDRLWKELGGSTAARELWEKKNKTIEVAKEGRWEKMSKPLPPWQLSDLEGKTWKLVQLEGKTLLVNLWATWCGPCRMEHPHLQKLFESLKDRSDVQVITFNVDDEIGKVAPYMKENKYSFPVLLARNYVDDLIPLLSIPRNWIVDAKGLWRWQQIGFGAEEKWQQDMLEKIDSSASR